MATRADLFGMPFLFAPVLTVFAGFAGRGEPRLSEKQYESLPGAADEQGHKCVHCGHRGIHRHTPYKTSTTKADCSKCKTPLWEEPRAKPR